MSGEYDWTLTWTATDLDGSTVNNAATGTTGVISNDGKLATEIAITIAYGGTATVGVKVYLLRDVDGTNYEAVVDLPWGFSMPYTASTTHRRTFTVPADIGSFKVHLTNDSGANVTATVDYRQAVAAA